MIEWLTEDQILCNGFSISPLTLRWWLHSISNEEDDCPKGSFGSTQLPRCPLQWFDIIFYPASFMDGGLGESSSSMDLLGKRITFISSGWLSWPTGSGNVSIMLRKWVIGSIRTRRTVISVPPGFDLIQFPSLPSATNFSSFLKTQTLTLVLRPICDCGWANCRLCCRVWSLFMSSPTAESVIHCNCTIYHGIMETTIRWLHLQMPYMAFGNGMEWMVVNNTQ